MKLPMLFLVAVLAAACADPAGPAATDPTQVPGSWALVLAIDEDGRRIPVDVEFTPGFDDDGNVGGRAGPNYWGGRYVAGLEGELYITEVVSTQIGGVAAEKGFRFLDLFAEARAYLVGTDDLQIRGRGRALLYFDRR